MSRGATMSILGLWEWDNSIFDMMQYPSYQDGETLHELSSDEKDMLIQNILAECSNLEILYPNPTVMKNMIGLWSMKEAPTWNRIFRAALAEYNPIENYHRTERATETLAHYDQHSGTDSNQASGSDTSNGGATDTHSGTDSNQASGSDTINGGSTDTHSGTDSIQASGSDTTNGGSTDTNSGTDTTTGKVVGYDSNILVTHDETDMVHGHVVTNVHNDGTTYGKKDTTTYGHVLTNTHNDGTTYGKKDTFTHGHVLTNTHNDGTTYGRKDTFTHGEKIDHAGTIKNDVEAFGNIGVTTNMQMLLQEVDGAAKLNVFNFIIESFKDRFCLLVY